MKLLIILISSFAVAIGTLHEVEIHDEGIEFDMSDLAASINESVFGLDDIAQHYKNVALNGTKAGSTYNKSSYYEPERKFCDRYTHGGYPIVNVPSDESVSIVLLSNFFGKENYTNNENCGWRLKTSNLYKINVTCSYYSVAAGDYLEARDFNVEDQRQRGSIKFENGSSVNFCSTSSYTEIIFRTDAKDTASGFKCEAVAIKDIGRYAWIAARYTWPGKDTVGHHTFNLKGERLLTVLGPTHVTVGIDYYKSNSSTTVYSLVNHNVISASKPTQSNDVRLPTSILSVATTLNIKTYSLLVEENASVVGREVLTTITLTTSNESEMTKWIKNERTEKEYFGKEVSIGSGMTIEITKTLAVLSTERLSMVQKESRKTRNDFLKKTFSDTNTTETSNLTESSVIIKSSQNVVNDEPIKQTPDFD